MNSRQRRRAEAIEHNERIKLERDLIELRELIYAKHKVSVPVTYSCNEGLRGEIKRLNGIFNSENPPKKSKSGRNVAILQLAAIAAMAGLERI